MVKPKALKTERPGLDKLVARGKTEYAEIKPWYIARATKVTEIICLGHNEVIALEAVMPGVKERAHADGAVVIPLGDQLSSFRRRADGTMGYACQCGQNSILLAEEAPLARTHALYPHIQEQITRELAKRTKQPTKLFKQVKVK